MEAKTRKRKGSQSFSIGVKKRMDSQLKRQDRLKNELATLDYKRSTKLQAFFRKYGSTSIPINSDGDMFTPWQGKSSNREKLRLSECSNIYINPPEDLKVIGYLSHVEENIVIMVGTKSGRVYMDEDEIVYIVADSLSKFAQHGCKKDPKYFDYYMSRPNDENSLPCAAGTVEDEEDMAMDTTDEWPVDYQELESDLVRADQLFEEMGSFLDTPETAGRGRIKKSVRASGT